MAEHSLGWRALTLHLQKSEWFSFLCMEPNALSPNQAMQATPVCNKWGRSGDLLQNCSAALSQNENIKPTVVSISLLSFLPSLFVVLVGKTDLTEVAL